MINAVLSKRILFLILSAVGLVTVVASLMPNVSPEYRDYFITRTSDCYPRPIDGHYAVDRTMDLTRGSEWPQHLIVCGVVSPEQDGAWTLGHHAELLLQPLAVRSYVLVLNISDVYLVGPSDYQRMDISANGVALGSSTFVDGRKQELSFSLPTAVIASGKGAVRIRLDLPDAKQGKTEREPRSLGVKLAAITLKSKR